MLERENGARGLIKGMERDGPRTKSGNKGIRALQRGLTVLGALADYGQQTVTELSRSLSLPYSTTYRILETLVAERFVRELDGGRAYGVSARAFEVGSAYVTNDSIQESARPVMRELAEQLGETVNLAVLDGKEAVYIYQIEGRHIMRAFTKVGARAPLYCSGVGKALLAWRPEDEVRSLLGNEPLEKYTPKTHETIDGLIRELAVVRREGYAVDNEERELGVRCVTAPVCAHSGEIVGAISISAPSSRLGVQDVPAVSKIVRGAAQRIRLKI